MTAMVGGGGWVVNVMVIVIQDGGSDVGSHAK